MITDRAGSGRGERMAIAGGTAPEAGTTAFGDADDRCASGRPYNRYGGLGGPEEAKDGQDAEQ